MFDLLTSHFAWQKMCVLLELKKKKKKEVFLSAEAGKAPRQLFSRVGFWEAEVRGWFQAVWVPLPALPVALCDSVAAYRR